MTMPMGGPFEMRSWATPDGIRVPTLRPTATPAAP
jgi:hypothetical protein